MSIKQGDYLKKLRTEHGLSQDALSEILGISRQSISKWEQGNSSPDIDNMGKLAKYYGVSIDSLVKGEPDEPSVTAGSSVSVNDMISGFMGTAQKKSEHEPEDMQISAPEPSLKEKKLLAEQEDERHRKEREASREKKQKEKKKRSWLFPSYPVLAVIVYCLNGALFGANGWKVGWIVLLTIPLFYTGIIAIEKEKPVIFCYPVLALIIFLLLGFSLGIWHPAWIIFLTIPVFYIIAAKAGKNKK